MSGGNSTFFSKIFEKKYAFSVDRVPFFENNDFLDIEQYGYRKHRSTLSDLIYYIEI